jgi:hypothetical protein
MVSAGAITFFHSCEKLVDRLHGFVIFLGVDHKRKHRKDEEVFDHVSNGSSNVIKGISISNPRTALKGRNMSAQAADPFRVKAWVKSGDDSEGPKESSIDLPTIWPAMMNNDRGTLIQSPKNLKCKTLNVKCKSAITSFPFGQWEFTTFAV